MLQILFGLDYLTAIPLLPKRRKRMAKIMVINAH